MMKIRLNKILLIMSLLILLLIPSRILAVSVTVDNICTDCSDQYYNILNYNIDGRRAYMYLNKDSRYRMHGYKDGNTRLFCVDPPRLHGTSYTKTSSHNEEFKKRMGNSGWYTRMRKHIEDIQKILSCRTDNANGSAAAQALIWELVSDERDGLSDYVGKILKNKDYKTNSIANFVPIYSRLSDGVKDYYKSTLRCAARYDIKPSFAELAQTKAPIYKLTNYSNGTYSLTLNDSNGYDNNLLKYYTVSSSDGAVKVSKTNSSITITSSKEIDQNNAVLITLRYSYKDNVKNLKTISNTYYYPNSKSNGIYPQALITGSRAGTVSYLKVYTPTTTVVTTTTAPTVTTAPNVTTTTTTTTNTVPAPNYHLRVKKQNEDGKGIEGVIFKIYSNSTLTQEVATIITDADGWATYENIKILGKYYVKEISTPEGYVTSDEVKTVDVTASNRFDLPYAESSSAFVNKYTHLKLSKRTIDSNGNPINISDYTESNCSGTYQGPKFIIKKNNKNIYVKEIKPGEYKISSSDENGSSEEIKTCNGNFDIKSIPSGCYNIIETEAPKGYTLPVNPTQQVCVAKGQDAVATVMYNGVTGVIFNKIDENGLLINGGKFSIQKKINGIYKDIQVKHESGAVYSYVEQNDSSNNGESYILETNNGVINIKNLPQGEYRFVEKEAPEGYDFIKDKDSKAKFTISDKGIIDSKGNNSGNYYLVKLVNQKTKVEGSYDSAELIVTIITGRKVANYTLIIAGLAVLLTVLIIIRKKSKK